jgi:hypothetical protein
MVLGLIYGFGYSMGNQYVFHNYDYFFNIFHGQGNTFFISFHFVA